MPDRKEWNQCTRKKMCEQFSEHCVFLWTVCDENEKLRNLDVNVKFSVMHDFSIVGAMCVELMAI